MFTRSSVFALVALTVVGVATAAAPASARGFGGGHASISHASISHASISHTSIGHVGMNRSFVRTGMNRSFAHRGMKTVFAHKKPIWNKGNKWNKIKWTKKWKWNKWAKWHHHHRWFRYGFYAYGAPSYVYGEPTYVAPTYTAPAAYSAPAPVASNCNCLTKHYENGAVIFEDVCTHEAAISTPQDQAQMQGPTQDQ